MVKFSKLTCDMPVARSKLGRIDTSLYEYLTGDTMRNLIALTLVLVSTAAVAAEPAPAPLKAPQPSANKGKAGQYQCHTSHAGYDYWVAVPASYSDSNPAGIHVFFHGQNCPQTAESCIPVWSKYESDPFNIIQVNMQYQDGDNMKDTPGKVAAAREAIAQTFADYKIVAGRGVVCSFSGGGVTHGLLFQQVAKSRGPEWPFCHSAQYSSNYRVPAPGAAPPMSWFFSVGSDEWSLAKLGEDATIHMMELEGAAAKAGVPDVQLKVIKGKGHSIDDREVEQSAKGFRRSELAFAPFLYEPDYTDNTLGPIVKQANALTLGPAMSALDRLIASKGTPDATKTKAEALKKHIADRVAAIVKVSHELADTDAILCNYYLPKYAQEIAGLPEAKELQTLLGKSDALKQLPQVSPLFMGFKAQLKTMFSPTCQLAPAAVPYLEQVVKVAGDKSEFGGMAAEFLLLK